MLGRSAVLSNAAPLASSVAFSCTRISCAASPPNEAAIAYVSPLRSANASMRSGPLSATKLSVPLNAVSFHSSVAFSRTWYSETELLLYDDTMTYVLPSRRVKESMPWAPFKVPIPPPPGSSAAVTGSFVPLYTLSTTLMVASSEVGGGGKSRVVSIIMASVAPSEPAVPGIGRAVPTAVSFPYWMDAPPRPNALLLV